MKPVSIRVRGINRLTRTAGLFLGVSILLGQPLTASDVTVALVKEEISVNGGVVEGNLQLTAPGSFRINGGFSGDGVLLFPGSPELQIHRKALIGFVEEGDGSEEPSGYAVRLQARTDIPGIWTRIDPPEFPSVPTPPEPAGDRDVLLEPGQTFDGDYTEIRDLALMTDADPFYLPPGHYGELIVQKGARLILGVGGEREPAAYTFTNIQWYKGAELDLLGPVKIETLSFPRPVSGSFGNPDRPEWISLGIVEGDWTLDRDAFFYGTLIAPNGVVTLQANSAFCGELFGRALALNPNAFLRYCEPSNVAPQAEDLFVATKRGEPVSFQLVGIDPDGDPLNYTLLDSSQNGELTGEAPDLVYTPFNGFAGEELLRYVVSDGELFSDEATVTIQVEAVNHPPFFTSEPVTEVDERTLYEYAVAVDDPDLIHGDALSISAESLPEWLSLADNGDGTAILSGAPGRLEVGEYSIILRASDSAEAIVEQAFGLTVRYVNQPPVADAQEIFADEGMALEIELTGVDPDGDELSYSIASESTTGALTGTPPLVTYTPAEGFFGLDQFSFIANDGAADSEAATVEIEINARPRVSLVEPGDGAVFLTPATISVAADATDPDGGVVSVSFYLDGELWWTSPDGSSQFVWEDPAPGTYGIEAAAVDDRGAEGFSSVIGITVRDPFPPSIVSDPQTRFIFLQERDYAYSVEVESEAGGLTFSLDQGPGGASINSATGLLEWAVAEADEGFHDFSVTVMDQRGKSATQAWSVEVIVGPDCERENPAGLTAWWTGDQTEVDAVSGLLAERRTGTAFADGMVNEGFSFSGSESGLVSARHEALNIGPQGEEGSFSVEFWSRPARVASEERIFEWRDVATNRNGLSLAHWGSSQMILRIVDAGGAISSVASAGGLVAAGQWRHVAVTYDHGLGRVTFYRDGLFHSQHNVTKRVPETSLDLYVGYRHPNLNFFQGMLDEISLYNRALRSDEISYIHARGGAGKCPPSSNLPPVVDAGADPFTRSVGDVAILNGTVTDDGAPFGDLAVRWHAISGPGQAFFADVSDPATTVGFSIPGRYVLELEAKDGMYVTRDRVDVRVEVPCEMANPSGLSAWWPWNGEGGESIHDLNTSPRRYQAQFPDGVVSTGLAFDGVRDGLMVERAPALDVGASGDFSVEFWSKPTRVISNERILEWRDDGGNRSGVSLAHWGTSQLILSIIDAGGAVSSVASAPGLVVANQWRHVAVTYDYEARQIIFYRDGNFHSRHLVTRRLPETSLDLYIGYRHPNSNYFQGVLDELSLYDRVLRSEEVSALHGQGAAGKCPPSPNQPPVASAGADLFADEVAFLDGAATDDGEPFGDLTVAWRMVSGPGEALFEEPAAAATAVSFTEPGIYVLELEADDGVYVFRDRVTVRASLSCDSENPSGLAAWWPMNGTLDELVEDLEALPRRHSMEYAAGAVSTGLRFDGIGDGLEVARNEALNIGEGGSFSVELWMNPARMASEVRVLEWRDAASDRNGVALALWGSSQMILRIFDASGSSSSVVSAANLLAPDQMRHVAVTYDQEIGVVTFYRNGVFHSQQSVNKLLPETSLDLYIGYRPPNVDHFQGVLDELSLYDRALQAWEVSFIYGRGAAGKCPITPNLPPVAFAGPDLFLDSIREVVFLEGEALDDGLPTGGSLAVEWRMVSGPGEAMFAEPSSPSTTVGFSEPGIYVLELEANDGMFASRDQVSVRAELPCDGENPSGLSVWWPWNDTVDEMVNNLATEPRQHLMAYADGAVSDGLVFDGTRDGLLARRSIALDIGAGGEFSFEFWTRPTRIVSEERILEWRDASSNRNGVSLAHWGSSQLILRVFDSSGSSSVAISASNLVAVNQWRHVAVTYQRDSGLVRFYRNGILHSQHAVTQRFPETSLDLHIGYRHPNLNHFQGVLDELSLYSRALQAEEVTGLYQLGEAGKCPVAPPPPEPVAMESSTETQSSAESYESAAASPIGPTSFSEWRASYFPEDERLDRPEETGPEGDPGGLGIPNLLRYGVGMRDGEIDRELLPRPVLVQVDGKPHLALSFHWQHKASDLEYVVEVSKDLRSWKSGEGITDVFSIQDAGETSRIVVRDLSPVDDGGSQFLRLRVRQKDPR